jgi:hypothetical protein
VRTAVDDFLAEHPDEWRLVELPGLHGVAILAAKSCVAHNPELARLLDGFEQREFLLSHVTRVEGARIEALVGPARSTAHPNGATTENGREPIAHAAATGTESVEGDPDEDAVEEDRIDALQARLELLERERNARLRDTAARLRMLEEERATLVREAAEARVAVAASQRDRERIAEDAGDARSRVRELERASTEAITHIAQLQGALDRQRSASGRAAAENAQQADALAAACSETARVRERLEANIGELIDERRMIEQYVARAAESRAWRIGHALTSFARLVTFRVNRGTSALGQLQERLARSPFELPGGDPAPSELTAGGNTANRVP